MQVGQVVYIPSGGYYQVASGSTPTFYLDNLGYQGNIPVGSAIASGLSISPGGLVGATGAGLNAFNSIATYSQDNFNTYVSIVSGAYGGWQQPGQVVYIQTGGYYTVTGVSGTNVLLGSLIGNQYSGSIIPSSNMSPAGPPAIDFAAPQGDSNSYIHWRLSEATGATIINNAVPGGVGATLTVNYSTNGNATLGKVGIFQNCAYFNGAAFNIQ